MEEEPPFVDAAADAPTDELNSIGRFRLLHELGRGSFAEVWLAWDPDLESHVAIKILARGKEKAKDRFLREARMLRRINSINVLSVHDTGHLDDGRPWFIVDYASRGNLQLRLQQAKSTTRSYPVTHLSILCQALANGLGAIHDAGLIHRDIKPGNILFATKTTDAHRQFINEHSVEGSGVGLVYPDERVLIGDLGIAKDLATGTQSSSMIGGTLYYLAPEQNSLNAKITSAADTYAATAVLWNVLTGRQPPLPEQLDNSLSHIDDDWHEFIEQGMHADAAKRFQTAEAWLHGVTAVIGDQAADTVINVSPELAEKTDVCPFKGLEAYQPEDATYFCGRESLTAELVSRLQLHNVLVVGGASGSGKSSLVRAGLVPALAKGALPGSDQWQVMLMTPGNNPVAELRLLFDSPQLAVANAASAGTAGDSSVDTGASISAVANPATENPAKNNPAGERPSSGNTPTTGNVVQRTGPGTSGSATYGSGTAGTDATGTDTTGTDTTESGSAGTAVTRLLIVDQFEEIFTQIDESQRRAFLDQLTTLINQPGAPVKLVIVVRADFYTECAKEPWLARSISTNQVLVSPMSPKELRRALTEPVRKVGLTMENGLVEAILNDCGNFAGSMPLMAHAMVETWVRRSGNTLTLEGFRACGGVTGAISNTADFVYDTKLTDSERSATRSLMLKLVSASDSGPDTRRIVKLSTLEADSGGTNLKPLVEQLTAARLLVVDNDEIQIAHEALLQSWPRLRRWIADSRDDLRTRERITHHAHDWHEMDRNDDLLYRGTALLTALEWQADNLDQLDPITTQFLQLSESAQQAREREAQEKSARTARFRRLAVSGLGVLALGASVASVFAFLAYKDSRHNALLATEATLQANARFAGALGATAFAHVDEDPRLALVLAAESVARANEIPHDSTAVTAASFDTRAAMISARQRLAEGGPFLFGSPMVAGNALSIALNPQGTVLAVGQLDGSVQFYDVQTREPIQPLVEAHSSGVRDIEFSGNGLTMVSSGADGVLLKWKRNPTGEWQAERLGSAADVIPDVDFHPHDGTVISANDDGTIKTWRVDGRKIKTEPVVQVAIGFNAVAITHDGTHVAAGNADKTLGVWSLANNEQVLGPLTDIHSSHLIDLQFTASSNGIVTLTTDGESKLISYPSGEDQGMRFQEIKQVGAMVLDRTTGRWLVGDASGRLSVWNVDDNQLLHLSAAGHTQVINDIALTRDSRLVATLGRDQVIRFWTLNDDYRLATEIETEGGAVKGIAYSPDGKSLVFGNRHGELSLWQLEPQRQITQIEAHDSQVWSLAYSPDSTLFASADRAGVVMIWRASTGQRLQSISVSEDPVWSLLFTRDNSQLIVGRESAIESYAVDSGELVRVVDSELSRLTRLIDAGDGATMISSSANGAVKQHSIDGSTAAKTLFTEPDIIWSVAVDQRRQLIASASGNETVGLYQLPDGDFIDSLTGHTAGATNVFFLGDGKTLVVTDRSGMIHWWDIDSRRRLSAPWRGHRKSIWRMDLHPDRVRFATAGDDGSVKVWSALDVGHACAIGNPGFDTLQRQQYFGAEHRLLACEK